MARAKSAKKKAAKRAPQIGHNSDEAAMNEELRKVAKAQRTLNKEKKDVQKDWREREKNLTERLEKIGFTRDQFKAPFKRFCDLADAKDDAEAKTVKEEHRIFLAQQRRAFDALGQGDTIDWVDLIQDADEIRKLREEEEQRAAEEAAAQGEDGEETETVH